MSEGTGADAPVLEVAQVWPGAGERWPTSGRPRGTCDLARSNMKLHGTQRPMSGQMSPQDFVTWLRCDGSPWLRGQRAGLDLDLEMLDATELVQVVVAFVFVGLGGFVSGLGRDCEMISVPRVRLTQFG